jgi:membrane protein involved in colicin uptake
MTTLRDFQNQIAELQSKENAKQRAIALLEKEKEANKKHPKAKERDKDKDKDTEKDKEQNGHTVVEEVEMNGAEDDRIQVCPTSQSAIVRQTEMKLI